MPADTTWRAGTAITYRSGNRGASLTDVCVAYPDPLNSDSYAAISLRTGKVGAGSTAADAYADVILAIALALRHRSKYQPQARIGIPAPSERWAQAETLHRMPEELQRECLAKARHRFAEMTRGDSAGEEAMRASPKPLGDTQDSPALIVDVAEVGAEIEVFH